MAVSHKAYLFHIHQHLLFFSHVISRSKAHAQWGLQRKIKKICVNYIIYLKMLIISQRQLLRAVLNFVMCSEKKNTWLVLPTRERLGRDWTSARRMRRGYSAIDGQSASTCAWAPGKPISCTPLLTSVRQCSWKFYCTIEEYCWGSSL